MLMYQKKNMFDRYYCIKLFFLRSKTLEKLPQKVFLPVPKSTIPANVLKRPLPGQRLTSSLLYTLLMMTSVFMAAPECLFVEPQSRASTARELPC